MPSAVQKWSHIFWRTLFRPDGLLRQEMLSIYLALVSLSTFLGYWITPIEPVAQANLALSVFTAGLWVVVRTRAVVDAVVHAVTALTLLLTIYTAMHTGGINSTAVVWLSVLLVSVLLMLGRAATQIWIGILLLAILALTLLTGWGAVDNHVKATSAMVTWAYMNHLLALLNLMMGVQIYDHLHKVQLRKLNQRNDELKATHEALIRAQAHRDEFVAAVGHELRTPMNVILGFNGVLRRELADEPELLAMVGHIRRSTEHLLQVVNDILDFSQLQAGRLHLHRVDFALQSLLDELEKRHAEKAQNKGLVLRFVQAADVPARVHADRARWLQILNNLVNNAIKFTHQGCVSVQVMVHNEHLRFEVQDEGPGIPLARQEHIFRRFEHADVQTNLADAGTGLGLTLCEKLVTLQGGRIGVVSREGHGARFWFEVPWVTAKTTALSSQEAFDHLVDEPLRILVVDDNPVNLMVAQLQLQKCWPKAQVTTADSGTQALSLLDRQLFDVALIDMIMPDMDGMQVTQQIRHLFPAATARMPILALTANTNPVDRERCLAAGMNDGLHKPMDSAVLVRAVAHHIRVAREAKW